MTAKAESVLTRLRFIAAACLFLLAMAIGHAVMNGDFYSEGKRLLLMPWGLLTLVDIYVGFILFCCWVLIREKTVTIAVFWTVAVMLLGNIASCIYILLAVTTCNGDIRQLLLGKYHLMEKT